ncbi:MAG TPA: hypothetical protein VD833_19040, partial [Vicinamibacterales bacterium]|nr:hypothetical protein [Vicinamibacterales bacterium]
MRTLLLLAVAALVAAAPQGNRSRPFGPGRCGPIDPSYVRVANETGGQPFPMAPSEMAHMAQVMSEKSRSDSALVLWAHGSAAESDPPHGVPVDASISRLTFSITFDGTGGTATITAPDGRAMQATAGTEDTVLNCGRFLIVDAPAVGSWQVAVRPSQRFWLVVHARSEIDLLAAEFVAPGGRAGHEGLLRIQGQPVRGRPAI